MAEVWTMGEIIVEIMRRDVGAGLKDPGVFLGPYPSGAPAIFIDTVARMGHSAGIVGGVGRDDFGDCLVDRLSRDGVDCSLILKDPDGTTGVAFVTYFEDGSRKFIYHIGNTPAVSPKAPDEKALQGIRYFHVMGCSLMAEPRFAGEILKMMKTALSLGARVSFDPNIRTELLKDRSVLELVRDVFSQTSVFMPGVDELLMLTGADSVEKAVEICFGNQKMEYVVLKRGSQGCTVYSRTEEYRMGVYPVEAVDPTGAGDSFDGAFLCGLLEGKPLPEIIQNATAAGALNTSAFGPMEGKISPAGVEALIRSHAGKISPVKNQ